MSGPRASCIAAAICLFASAIASAQVPAGADTPPASSGTPPSSAPLPNPDLLLKEVQQNEERMDRLRNEYTYHVHMEEQRFRGNGTVKESESTDAESLTLRGVRVDRVVARNGKPLTADEQGKENDRLEKEVAKAQERRAKASAAGQTTDPRGDTVITAARLLELGSLSNERRILLAGRPTILMDYIGDPKAKTRNPAEGVVKDLLGSVWIDETDRVIVRAQGHFVSDFKIGGGLLADVHKGSHFDFEATHVNGAVWLPSTINGQGSVRILLVAGFNGQLHLVTSDYRRFHTSATIIEKPTKESPALKLEPGASRPEPPAPANRPESPGPEPG